MEVFLLNIVFLLVVCTCRRTGIHSIGIGGKYLFDLVENRIHQHDSCSSRFSGPFSLIIRRLLSELEMRTPTPTCRPPFTSRG